MAERTQAKWLPGSASDGAAASAPTAPHATERGGEHTPTGPERFWTAPRWRWVVGASLGLSLVIHYVLTPWTLLPQQSFEIRDVAGDLAIPVDLLEGDKAPEEKKEPGSDEVHPNAATPPGDKLDKTDKTNGPDGGLARRDAGPPRATVDGGLLAAADGGPQHDAGVGVSADAAVAQAGQVSGVARDAVGMIGAAGAVQAGPQNVIVTINMALIRTHPVGSRLGPLLSAIPQWVDFLAGTGVDPVRDTDWISINGPSMIHSDRLAITIHYSAADSVVDHGLDVVAHKASGRPFDVGVPGVKAVLGNADHADRVFMRPQPHVLAVVPVAYAPTAARILAHATIGRTLKRPGEAMRMTLLTPHRPMPSIPESITELRLWIVPRNSDGGADVFGEGDTADPATCQADVATLKSMIDDMNSMVVQLLTHNLLGGIELTADGPTVRLHAPVSRLQLEALLAFVAGKLGVTLPPADGGLPQ